MNPIIVESISIEDTDGANSVLYDLVVEDSIDIQTETQTTRINDGQTIKDWTQTLLVINTYDLSILSDSRIATGATILGISNIVLNKPDGELRLNDVRIRGYKDYGLNRDSALIQCSLNDRNGFFDDGIGIWIINQTFIVQ